jgi:hypothetical protein
MKLKVLLKDILDECLSFFLRPREYWQQIKTGNNKNTFSFHKFFLPVLVLSFIFIVGGHLLFHIKEGFVWQEALVKAFQKILFLLFVWFFSIIAVRMVLKWFKIGVKMGAIKKIMTYSCSPALLTALVTGLLPFLDLGGIAPWYGLFLAYTGLETFFIIPEKKKFYFYFVLFMCVFSIIMIFSFSLKRIGLYILN